VPAAVPFREIAMVRFLDDRFPAIEEMRRLEDIATHEDAQPDTAVGTAL
jgi:hypothetical protein